MEDATVIDYRTCFSTDAGMRVLADLLKHSGYFDADIKSEGEIAVQNFIKTVLKNLGIYQEKGKYSYVQKLFELPSEL